MSPNPEVKLARNTELAFTEAHLTYLNRKLCNRNMQCNARFSISAGALPQTPLGEPTALPRPIAGFKGPYF